MSILRELASVMDGKGDVLNQELAQKIIENNDFEAIQELVANLSNKEKAIQSDCIKVLYEVGYINPHLIAEYVNDFIDLLTSKNNRLVWGAMIALSTIAGLKSAELFKQNDIIKSAIENGSVITMDAGVKTLAGVAAFQNEYNNELFPYLIEVLKHCRPKSVAQYAESISTAVIKNNIKEFNKIVNTRKESLTPSQLKRIEKLLNTLSKTINV